jgi:hypothetical protein
MEDNMAKKKKGTRYGRSILQSIMLIVLMVLMVVSCGIAVDAEAASYKLIPGQREFSGQLGEDGKSWDTLYLKSNVIFEGATSDDYEATLTAPDPGSDITYTLPATSGTLAITTGLPAGGTDAQIQISNGTIYQSKSVSGDITITNAGVATIGALAVESSMINTDAVTTAKILDDAVTSDKILANAVAASEAYINSTTVWVAGGETYGSAATPDGAVMIGWQPLTNSTAAIFANTVDIIAGTDLAVVCTTAAVATGHNQSYKINYFMP